VTSKPLSPDQFGIVRYDIASTGEPTNPEFHGPHDVVFNIHEHDSGDWAGRASYRRQSAHALGDDQFDTDTGGPGQLSMIHVVPPEVGAIMVEEQHRGHGLANRIANAALTELYRDHPSMRGDTSVVNSYLSPHSTGWRERLTGEDVPPSWGYSEDISDAEMLAQHQAGTLQPDNDVIDEWVRDTRAADAALGNGAIQRAATAGDFITEPDSPVEERMSEFRQPSGRKPKEVPKELKASPKYEQLQLQLRM